MWRFGIVAASEGYSVRFLATLSIPTFYAEVLKCVTQGLRVAFPVISNVLGFVAPEIRIGDDVVCRFRLYYYLLPTTSYSTTDKRQVNLPSKRNRMDRFARLATLIILLHNPPSKFSKSKPRPNLLLQIRLRKHSKSIPRNLLAGDTLSPLNKMRNGHELPLRNKLQRFASLEGKTILRDIDLDDLTCSRADIQAS